MANLPFHITTGSFLFLNFQNAFLLSESKCTRNSLDFKLDPALKSFPITSSHLNTLPKVLMIKLNADVSECCVFSLFSFCFILAPTRHTRHQAEHVITVWMKTDLFPSGWTNGVDAAGRAISSEHRKIEFLFILAVLQLLSVRYKSVREMRAVRAACRRGGGLKNNMVLNVCPKFIMQAIHSYFSLCFIAFELILYIRNGDRTSFFIYIA